MLACQCHSLFLISCPIPAFHVSCLVLLCVHCFSHLLSSSCFGPVGKSPQYLLDCQFHALLLIRCLMSAVHRFCLFPYICCRPYHVECTGSLPTSEVKRHRARLVLGWGTAWEDLRVLTAPNSRTGDREKRERGGREGGRAEGGGGGGRGRGRGRGNWPLPLPLPLPFCVPVGKIRFLNAVVPLSLWTCQSISIVSALLLSSVVPFLLWACAPISAVFA